MLKGREMGVFSIEYSGYTVQYMFVSTSYNLSNLACTSLNLKTQTFESCKDYLRRAFGYQA